MATLSRKEEEKDLKRLEILNVAKEIFEKKGFLQTTIEEIATSSRVSIGTIYNCFKNKETLYENILHKISIEFIKVFEKDVLSQKDLSSALKKIIEIRFLYFEKYRGFFSAFFEAAFEGAFSKNENLKNSCINFRNAYLKQLQKIFKKYESDLKNSDPMYLALLLEGSLHAVISQKILEYDKYSTSESIEKIFLIFKNLIK